MKPKIKCIAFDLDGVLYETRDNHKEALNKALLMHNCQPISEHDHVTLYNGLPTKIKLQKLKERGKIPSNISLAEIEKSKQFFTEELILQNVKEDKRLSKLLSKLKEQYHLVCVTNSIRNTTEKILSQLGVYQYFDHIITNEDVAKAKPFPEPYLAACQKTQCHPSQVLVIEDSLHGIESAKSAGCHIYSVASPADVKLKEINKRICQIIKPE